MRILKIVLVLAIILTGITLRAQAGEWKKMNHKDNTNKINKQQWKKMNHKDNTNKINKQQWKKMKYKAAQKGSGKGQTFNQALTSAVQTVSGKGKTGETYTGVSKTKSNGKAGTVTQGAGRQQNFNVGIKIESPKKNRVDTGKVPKVERINLLGR